MHSVYCIYPSTNNNTGTTAAIVKQQTNNTIQLIILPFVSAELKMDVLREREVKDSLERQLLDEQKIRGKQAP